jgi:ribosomal-protein-alanine N-acetyltransferase
VNFLTLQPLTSDYLQDAVALDRRCLGGLWTQDGYQREIDSPNSDLLMLLDEQHDEPEEKTQVNQINQTNALSDALDASEKREALIGLACAWAILDEAHITLLAIDPAYRQQGLGQLMLYALLKLAQQRGMEWATLEVRASNQVAISLYQKFGFESVGRRPGYYQNQERDQGQTTEDALILWRKGLQRPEFEDCLSQWRRNLDLRLSVSKWHLVLSPSIDLNLDGSSINLTKSTLPP